MHEETTKAPDETVIGEIQRGYRIRDRVLRPSLVSVAKNPGSDAGSRRERLDHGQDHRHRPGHDQLCRGRHGGRRADGHPQRRGRPHRALGGGLLEDRGAAHRPGREAAGDHQLGQHGLLDQALHGSPLGRPRGAALQGPRALQAGARPQERRRQGGAGGWQELHAARDQRHDPAEAQDRRRGLPGREGHRGGHHRPGLLRRHAAPGHEGRRPHRRPRGQAHHQRADRLRAGLRPGQEEGREDRRLRPRRRHLRHLHPRARRRRLRGQGDQRRHAPRRRRLRPARHRLAGQRVQEGPGHRPDLRPAGDAAPQGGGREGQGRAELGLADGDQPALHHRRRVRAQDAPHDAHSGEARGPRARTSSRRRRSRSSRPSRTPASRRRTSTRSSSSAA